MRWKGRRVSTNVEDRRGGGGVKAGGISIIGLIVAFVAWKFLELIPNKPTKQLKRLPVRNNQMQLHPKFNAEQKKQVILLEQY
jgi:predicted metalloprotease